MVAPPPIRALEFYSGIGGLHLGLSRVNSNASVVRAFDWDQTACRVYDANHGAGIAQKTDISTLTSDALAAYDADLWLLSPACQPYTVLNPNAKGAEDPRAQSYLRLLRSVLPALALEGKHPEYILVENVAGFEGSTTRQVQLEVLKSLGYHVVEVLLSPLQFGIPNSRLRYYLLARRTKSFHLGGLPGGVDEETKVWRHIPGQPEVGEEERSMAEIREYLDEVQYGGGGGGGGGGEEWSEFAVKERVLAKWGRLFDIVGPSGRRSCCFTRGYTHLVERSGSILQENEELDTTKTFDTFLKAQEEQEADPVKILQPLRLRYFSPSELLRIFAFQERRHGNKNKAAEEGKEKAFVWPDGVSTKSKYKLIGNSVNVRVVEEVIRYLLSED